MAPQPVAIVITAEEDSVSGDDYVYVNGKYLGRRPFDGSDDALEEVVDALVTLLGDYLVEKMRWKRDDK